MVAVETKPFLMGAETEYAVAGRGPEGEIDPDEVYEALADAVKEEHAWVYDRSGYRGLFLEHGGRLYLDYGSHPEHATPECFTPIEVACYDKAGEALLECARRRVAAGRGWKVTVVKANLDPVNPDDVTYGTHESYTSWVTPDVLGPQLLPHLASRVMYAGAGGLTAHPLGHGFELSQRARHLTSASGHCTTGDRALFGMRIRKDSDHGGVGGWVRVHLISKDAQRAPFGIYLTYATTGLLIEMTNCGRKVGRGLALANPIAAVQAFSRDPWLRAPAKLEDGRHMTALELQLCYLEECERALQGGGLPEWAAEAVGHWRSTLEALAKGPLHAARRLDAYCKLFIYEHELLRAGYDWADLRSALQTLNLLRAAYDDGVVAAVVAGSPARLSDEEAAAYATAVSELGLWRDAELERLRFAVRLQALDVHYHELGGLYDKLREARRIEHVVLSTADVERAMREPPAGGRAAARGGWIKAHADEPDWAGDWQYLWHPPTQRCVDLRDPFSGVLHALRLDLPPEVPPVQANVLELLRGRAVPA